MALLTPMPLRGTPEVECGSRLTYVAANWCNRCNSSGCQVRGHARRGQVEPQSVRGGQGVNGLRGARTSCITHAAKSPASDEPSASGTMKSSAARSSRGESSRVESGKSQAKSRQVKTRQLESSQVREAGHTTWMCAAGERKEHSGPMAAALTHRPLGKTRQPPRGGIARSHP